MARREREREEKRERERREREERESERMWSGRLSEDRVGSRLFFLKRVESFKRVWENPTHKPSKQPSSFKKTAKHFTIVYVFDGIGQLLTKQVRFPLYASLASSAHILMNTLLHNRDSIYALMYASSMEFAYSWYYVHVCTMNLKGWADLGRPNDPVAESQEWPIFCSPTCLWHNLASTHTRTRREHDCSDTRTQHTHTHTQTCSNTRTTCTIYVRTCTLHTRYGHGCTLHQSLILR